MSNYQGKHRREGAWAQLSGRIRDTCDEIADPRDRYVGKHRDESDLALGRDILTAVGAL